MQHKRQQHIAKNIQQKVTKNNALITLADKEKTTVIIYKKDYEEKVHTFLTDNNIHSPPPGDPTKKHQTLVSKALQQCNHIHSFSILSDDRFKASSKTIPPHSAI
jgi:citrate lyase synthetase